MEAITEPVPPTQSKAQRGIGMLASTDTIVRKQSSTPASISSAEVFMVSPFECKRKVLFVRELRGGSYNRFRGGCCENPHIYCIVIEYNIYCKVVRL